MNKRVSATDQRQQKAPCNRVAGAFLCFLFVIALPGCDKGAVDLDNPQAIYDNYCFACHDTGAAGAPRMDQAGFWQSVAADRTRLYESTIKGVRAMPRRGTCLSCSDDQLKRVVDWMVVSAASTSTAVD